MTLLERWQQLAGIRPGEGRTVGLFFLHHFLLGVGTVLVYVAANVILLENQPERNLPLAYGLAALAMMTAGQVYARFEHRWPLERLAGRVLLAVVVLTGVLGVLVAVGHSVAAAVAIMAGYRVIYLFTNLEFWGVSAVVFDVRQGKRLFGLISSGDMPAKALGAVLAILVHHHAELLWLLLTAFGAYAGALLTLRATLRLHVVEARPAPRRARLEAVAPGLQRWFGSSRLVLSMCLSVTAIAAVFTGVEYAFFVNVKARFHDQAEVMRVVGSVLALTYLLAMLFKLLLSRVALDRVGVRRLLLALPLTMLAGLGLFAALRFGGPATSLLLYFCGLYLLLEVLRRAVFDPVFLVLFQPLSPPERLQGHTLAKGFYEPLGMGLAGVLLFTLHDLAAFNDWLPFVWMSLFAVGALLFLHRTFRHYLAELQHAVGRRFTEADEPTAPGRFSGPNGVGTKATAANTAQIDSLVQALADKAHRAAAAEQLTQLGEAAVPALQVALTSATDEALVRRAAQVCGHIRTAASRQALIELARQPHLFRREVALRAMRNFAPQAAEAPVFEALVQEELRLAQQLVHGQQARPDDALRRSLSYELGRVQQRIFGLLHQLHAPQLIADAQRGVAHAARERQANALEILDNVIARGHYQGLQALLEESSLAHKARVFDQLLGPAANPGASLPNSIIQRGEAAFSDWTISQALRYWQPGSAQAGEDVLPLLQTPNALIRESALTRLAELARDQPATYQALLTAYPSVASLLMSHSDITARVSATERVSVLQGTALFAETPANVLSSIVPIMKEVAYHDGQQIFAKGDVGASLFIVYEGEVGIFNGSQLLATFRQGDFFGELALLDAEPRSATAVAQGSVLAFRIDQEDFYDVMEERGEVLRNILRVLCQRLRRQNEAMAVNR